MKWNKAIVVTALLASGLATAIPRAHALENADSKPAQKEGRRGQVADRLEKMAKELNLTTDQKEKLKGVFKDEAEKMKGLREDKNLSKEDRRSRLKSIHEDFEGQLKNILTPEQQEKWAKLRSEGRKSRKERN